MAAVGLKMKQEGSWQQQGKLAGSLALIAQQTVHVACWPGTCGSDPDKATMTNGAAASTTYLPSSLCVSVCVWITCLLVCGMNERWCSVV